MTLTFWAIDVNFISEANAKLTCPNGNCDLAKSN